MDESIDGEKLRKHAGADLECSINIYCLKIAKQMDHGICTKDQNAITGALISKQKSPQIANSPNHQSDRSQLLS